MNIVRSIALFLFFFILVPLVPVPLVNAAPKDSSLRQTLGVKEQQGKSDAPLLVKSDTLSLDSRGQIFVYKGHVQVDRDDLRITAEQVEGRYDDKNRMKSLTALGNVVITRGEGMRATSNRAVYFVPESRIELTETPELYRNGNILAADKVTIFVNEDRSEAEGNVRMKVIKENSADGTKR